MIYEERAVRGTFGELGMFYRNGDDVKNRDIKWAFERLYSRQVSN